MYLGLTCQGPQEFAKLLPCLSLGMGARLESQSKLMNLLLSQGGSKPQLWVSGPWGFVVNLTSVESLKLFDLGTG